MEIVENVALISINATLVVQLLSFLLFMVLFNRIMIRPLRKVMVERDHYMTKVQQEIHAAHAGYAQISQQIQNQERDARKAAFKIREEIEAQAQTSASDSLAQTKVEIQSLRLASQRQADEKIAEMRRQIEHEAEAIAGRMVDALLGRRTT